MVAACNSGVLTAIESPSGLRPEHKAIAYPSRMHIVRSPPIKILSLDEEVRADTIDRELRLEDDLIV